MKVCRGLKFAVSVWNWSLSPEKESVGLHVPINVGKTRHLLQNPKCKHRTAKSSINTEHFRKTILKSIWDVSSLHRFPTWTSYRFREFMQKIRFMLFKPQMWISVLANVCWFVRIFLLSMCEHHDSFRAADLIFPMNQTNRLRTSTGKPQSERRAKLTSGSAFKKTSLLDGFCAQWRA